MKITSIAVTTILGYVSAAYEPPKKKKRSFPITITPEESGSIQNATVARSIDPSLEASTEVADLSETVKVLAEEDDNKEVSSASDTILAGVALATSMFGALVLF